MATPMTSNQSSPRRRSTLSAHVLKVMSVFGGVQIVSILCSIVRTKLVAVWLGPAGIGLFGIYLSVFESVGALTQGGLSTGVVRELALCARSGVARMVNIVRRWSLSLGVLGLVVCALLAPVFSRSTFGDSLHTPGFILVAIAIFFTTLYNLDGAVMQGLKRYRPLALSTIWGTLIGLACSIPMFYFWGLESIAPAILIGAFANWGCRHFLSADYPLAGPRPGAKETFITGKQFIMLGLFVAVTTFVTNFASYIFMTYLYRVADTSTAGFFQAGFTLVNRYVGIVLTAIGMEYLPRLSEVSRSKHRSSLFLTHEIILIMAVIFPVITLFIASDSLIVWLLYNDTFQVMLPFITWAVIGTVFRAWSWCVAFVILAHSDGPAFLFTEITSAIAYVVLNIVFFNQFGIAGMGYAYMLWYAIYLATVIIVCRRRYGVTPHAAAVWLPSAIFVICAATVLIKTIAGFAATIPFVLLSIVASFIILRRLLGFRNADIANLFVKTAKKD